MGIFDFFSKQKKETLDEGLKKTKDSFLGKIARAIVGKSKVDEEVLDNLEEILITSDVGVETTLKIIGKIEARVKKDKVLGTEELNGILKEEIENLLEESQSGSKPFDLKSENKDPYVIMVVGVNGVGKTTTIGKLAHQFKTAGSKVILGASDTFRAAATKQLEIWSEKIGAKIRNAELNKIPIMLIVGENEAKDNSLSIRRRLVGDQGIVNVDKFLSELLFEIKQRSIPHRES